MKAGKTAIIAAMMAAMLLLVPIASDDSEALVENGIYIQTADNGDSVAVSMNSGSTKTVQLFVTNMTEYNQVLTLEVTGLNGDISYSYSVVGENDVSSSVVQGGGGLSVVTITLTADGYADTAVVDAVIDVSVMALVTGSITDFQIPLTLSVNSVFTSGDSYNKFFGVFPNTLSDPLDNPWVTATVTLVLWIIATIIVSEIIIPLCTRFVGDRKTKDEKKSLTKQVTTSITVIMFAIALTECTQIVGANAEVSHLVGAFCNAIYIIFGAVMSWQIYLFIVSAFLKGLDETTDVDGMDMSLLPLFKMIGKLAIAIVAVCATLGAFGVDLAGMLVSAGVVTLGITLGAQNTLNQFFSGIVLLATRPFKKDDFVSIGGTTYRVRKVKLMYTEFYNWDNDQIITMPNNTVSAATIVNFTRDSPKTRVFVYIDVAYGSDIALTKECLERAGRKHPHVIKDGSCSMPGARLTNFADSGIEFRLSCYVDDYDNSSHYAGQIRELVYQELNDAGIEIPYSRIQVDILTDPSDNRPRPENRSILRNPQDPNLLPIFSPCRDAEILDPTADSNGLKY